MTSDHTPVYRECCTTECNLRVSPHDPEAIERHGVRYHGACYRKMAAVSLTPGAPIDNLRERRAS